MQPILGCMVYLTLIKKVLPYGLLLIVGTLGCLFFTATLNLSASVADSSTAGDSLLPPANIPVPIYDDDAPWCSRTGERHPENPFSGWPVADPSLQQVAYITSNTVTLCSGEWWARYFHLNAVAEGLVVGETVTRGQLLGFVGNTGAYTTGTHLHYDMYNGDGFWDPFPTLR